MSCDSITKKERKKNKEKKKVKIHPITGHEGPRRGVEE
jgi:hypothetical protein